MIINFIGVGNENEAFIEASITEKLNIISSDDNNRGKTILIQSLMYCLGNRPAFPSTFNYNDYFHIVGFSVGETDYKLCRKNNSFALLKQDKLMVFDNISELKRYWRKNVLAFPVIKKDGIDKVVDPELYYQLNFVGQDKKDTSNIANKGYYNKADFYNMLLSMKNLNGEDNLIDNIEKLKKDLTKLKAQRKTLLKKYDILKKANPAANYLSEISNKESFKMQIKELEILKEQLTDLIKQRNNALTRKNKCEVTIKELRSLNRVINRGELRCLDCNSRHISYFSAGKNEYNFDVSTPEVRNQIIESIMEKIEAYNEEIQIITYEINVRQSEMKKVLAQDEVELETLLAFKQEYFDDSTTETQIKELDIDIEELEDLINNKNSKYSTINKDQKDFLDEITKKMNNTYLLIDPYGNLNFESIFTKSTQIFSGSEATIYHLVKLYSIAKLINHKLPIIVDSFRAEDLSTEKEAEVLKIFDSLDSQIIFTTTLKDEEIGKYDNQPMINHIDYSANSPSKILKSEYVKEFNSILAQFSISI